VITLPEDLMPAELPIACSLTATELPVRLADMTALGREALVDVRREPAHAELRFAAGDGIRDRVDAIVQAEARCCAFLTMDVHDEPDLVVLDITAPADADLVITELVHAFRSGTQLA
jgi:hypothetical protein